MTGDAAIAANELDFLLDSAATDFRLFGPPREPIPLADHAAGLHAASLVPDGGTLQIGIGSLGDAVAHALVLRHRKPDDFRAALVRLRRDPAGDPTLHAAPFVHGLYGCSEMFVEAFLELFRAGVLKREVDGAVLDAGFLLGSRAFYQALREMPADVRAKFHMRSISYVNQLYGDEDAKRRARVGARFVNAAMMATLLGDVVSDGLDDGRIVSGVGGQYNFVAQGFALEDARSVIMLRASRTVRGKTQSNIRWRYGHTTIPRHLRDIIVTEYGVADIRGKPDREVIARMLAIADARFQDDLLRAAKDAGKIERTFEVPQAARDNTPDALARALAPAVEAGLLPTFPFGTDFTAAEQRLLPALELLKSASPGAIAGLLARGMFAAADRECLARLQLSKPTGVAERFYAALVRGALNAT
jgi:acyl-CoA hydrolase